MLKRFNGNEKHDAGIVYGTVCKDGDHVWIELIDRALPDYKDCYPITLRIIPEPEYNDD